MSILDLLRPEAILINLDAADSSEVITRLGNVLHASGCVHDGFIEAALKREASMPTGLPLMGDINAAIPHVDIEYVKKSSLALATLSHEVAFCNMVNPDEAVPVRLVIMLALDQPKSQVETLQEVAGLLQNPQIVSGLMQAKTPEEILSALRG